ncbi:hypothetical protein H8Z60_24215 [Mycolicibacterium fortuitum]|nr:hypothetical protein [Mycolicibacterium fortuitum]
MTRPQSDAAAVPGATTAAVGRLGPTAGSAGFRLRAPTTAADRRSG